MERRGVIWMERNRLQGAWDALYSKELDVITHMTKPRLPLEHKEAKPGRRDVRELLLHELNIRYFVDMWLVSRGGLD